MPIHTNRPRRHNEVDPNILFESTNSMCRFLESPEYICHRIARYYYSIEVAEVEKYLKKYHVIIGFTPATIVDYQKVFNDMFTVLVWPDDFRVLQIELLASKERPMAEKMERINMNENLKKNMPSVDYTIINRFINDEIARTERFGEIMHDLIDALDKTIHLSE